MKRTAFEQFMTRISSGFTCCPPLPRPLPPLNNNAQQRPLHLQCYTVFQTLPSPLLHTLSIRFLHLHARPPREMTRTYQLPGGSRSRHQHHCPWEDPFFLPQSQGHHAIDRTRSRPQTPQASLASVTMLGRSLEDRFIAQSTSQSNGSQEFPKSGVETIWASLFTQHPPPRFHHSLLDQHLDPVPHRPITRILRHPT